MLIYVISDTHIKKNNLEKLEHFLSELPTSDLLIHCGDISCYEAYELIDHNTQCVAVYGNVDDDRCRDELRDKEIIRIMNYKIGVFHGHGEGGTTLKRVKNIFEKDKVDIIVYGHSHKPNIFTEDGILFLNPGSVFYKRKERWFSYIVLELEEEYLEAKLHFYKTC
ncbi:MAG: YfcE family phosphodiesterase [Bacillota bacterium]|nr:YfcE family phosphodiesterase [Bacillota bacterium]